MNKGFSFNIFELYCSIGLFIVISISCSLGNNYSSRGRYKISIVQYHTKQKSLSGSLKQ